MAIAATLALGTDILILDEPTSELDEHATKRIVAILSELKKQGKTILIVEHKYSHFKDLVDTLVVMENGAISAIGTPGDMLADERIRKIVVANFSGIRPPSQKKVCLKKTEGPSDAIIQVRNLSHAYGDLLALDSISLLVNTGEFVALVGENGSGKTTLVKHFNRLLTPSRGAVVINGKNTRDSTITELAHHVGLVFQNPDHMFFADTVWEEVEFGLKNLGISNRDTIILAALSEVGLEHTTDLYPRWLSRGERQRLAIACVIAMQPVVIVLDEPTTGLDGNEARLVLEILKALQQKGHTIVIITHNKDIALMCADRIVTMEQGKIVSDLCNTGSE